jgi:hypothetical protein
VYSPRAAARPQHARHDRCDRALLLCRPRTVGYRKWGSPAWASRRLSAPDPSGYRRSAAGKLNTSWAYERPGGAAVLGSAWGPRPQARQAEHGRSNRAMLPSLAGHDVHYAMFQELGALEPAAAPLDGLLDHPRPRKLMVRPARQCIINIASTPYPARGGVREYAHEVESASCSCPAGRRFGHRISERCLHHARAARVETMTSGQCSRGCGQARSCPHRPCCRPMNAKSITATATLIPSRRW